MQIREPEQLAELVSARQGLPDLRFKVCQAGMTEQPGICNSASWGKVLLQASPQVSSNQALTRHDCPDHAHDAVQSFDLGPIRCPRLYDAACKAQQVYRGS